MHVASKRQTVFAETEHTNELEPILVQLGWCFERRAAHLLTVIPAILANDLLSGAELRSPEKRRASVRSQQLETSV